MADGRDTADGEARAFSDEIRVRLSDGLAHEPRKLVGVDASRSGGHHEKRAIARLGAEHEGVGDLPDFAAEKVGGGFCGARRARQLDDVGVEPCALERLAYAFDAWTSQDGGDGGHPEHAGSRAAGLYNPRVELIAAFWDWIVHLDVHLAAFVAQHGAWVYGLLFVIVFCETGLVVTPFLPGDSLLFVAGAIAAVGEMNIVAVVATLIAAALCGDNVNYWIGRWAGPKVFGRLLNPVHLQRAHDFYERHGGKTIILARFVPIVRTYAPFVAGIGAMPYLRYLAFCLAGAVIWVGSLCTVGYFFGNIPLVKNNLTAVILIIVLLSISPGIIAWLRSRWGKIVSS